MKKNFTNLLLAFFLVGFTSTNMSAQNVFADYETVTPDGVGTFGGSVYSVVGNPDKTDPNTSDNVGKFVTAGETWEGIFWTPGGNIDFTGTKVFTMHVKAPVNGDIIFKLEKADDANTNVEVTSQYTGSGSWQEVSFDFTSQSPVNDLYGKIVIFMDYGGTDVNDWLFDNLTGPALLSDGLVDLTFQVTDKLNSTSMSVDFDGANTVLTNDEGIWSATVTNVALGNYTWDLNVDGSSYKTGIVCEIPLDIDAVTTKYKVANTDLVIGKVASAPLIDGVIDGMWDNVVATDMSNVFNGGFDDAADHSANFKAVWDATNLYVLIEITDQTLYSESGNEWDLDCAEVLIDIDNAGGNGYDNDYQVRYVWNQANSGKGTSAQANVLGGWLIEIALPWTYFDENYTALEGALIGMDVSSTDNDGSGRDGTHAWMATEDNGWWNPAVFGQVELGTLVSTDILENKVVQLQIYPNPASDVLNIQGLEEGTLVEIYGAAGSLLKKVQLSGGTVNVSDLAKGVYFVSANGATSKIIKK